MAEDDGTLSLLQDESTIEEAVQKEEEILKNFLSQFDRDEAKNWAEYFNQIKTKLNLPISKIVEKYNEDPSKATEKFQLWLGKHIKS
jgi:hypothetical protein